MPATRELFRENLCRLLDAEVEGGMLLQDLAKKMGMSLVKLSQFRAGDRFPRPERIDRIAKVLGVKVHELFVPPKSR